MQAGAPGHQGSSWILPTVGVRPLMGSCLVRSGGSGSAGQSQACSCKRLGKGKREGPFLLTKPLCLLHPLTRSRRLLWGRKMSPAPRIGNTSSAGSASNPLSALRQVGQTLLAAFLLRRRRCLFYRKVGDFPNNETMASTSVLLTLRLTAVLALFLFQLILSSQ